MTGPATLTIQEAENILNFFNADEKNECRNSKMVRNSLLYLLMLEAGLRVSEVSGLLVSDLWLNGEPRHSLRVRPEIAKGNSERIIPLTLRIKKAIADNHKTCWKDYWKQAELPAFTSKDSIRPLSDRQIERIIGQAATAVIGRWVNPHVLRHTFATNLMRTCNVRVVQELLGHKHLASTQIYTHPNEQDKTDAINSLPKGGD